MHGSIFQDKQALLYILKDHPELSLALNGVPQLQIRVIVHTDEGVDAVHKVEHVLAHSSCRVLKSIYVI